VRPQVLAADGVRASAVGVGEAGLAVRRDDDREQRDDADRDPGGEVEQGKATEAEDQDDLLGGVGDGAQRVGAEDRQREPLGQQRVAEPVAPQRATDDDSVGTATGTSASATGRSRRCRLNNVPR